MGTSGNILQAISETYLPQTSKFKYTPLERILPCIFNFYSFFMMKIFIQASSIQVRYTGVTEQYVLTGYNIVHKHWVTAHKLLKHLVT